MDAGKFAAEVLAALPYRANDQQVQVVAALTGALVRTLEQYRRPVMLLAPTGRAAKVFSANAGGHVAFTIHRKIYRHNPFATPGVYVPPMPADNRLENAVFIVDEASMIGGKGEDAPSLLEDLITYVYSGENCRMILIGDTAQLPPVGSETSPAMNPEVLRRFGLKVSRAIMTETARQAADSGILFNATRLRRAMARIASLPEGQPMPVPLLRTAGFDDVTVVSGEDLPELISTAYSGGERGLADTILITRSNRRAAEYNAAIRADVPRGRTHLRRFAHRGPKPLFRQEDARH